MTMLAATPVYESGQFSTSRLFDPGQESTLKRELDALVGHDRTVFEFLMKVSLDCLWILDIHTPENGWLSPRFWELLGYDPERDECQSSEWAKMMHPDKVAATAARFEEFKLSKDAFFDETIQFRHRDGSPVWLRARGMAVRDGHGTLVRMIGAHNDITALKRTEAELLRGQEELTASLAKASEANAWLEMAEQVGKVGHWRLSLSDGSLVWSNEVYRIFGLAPENFTPDLQSVLALYHPDDGAKVARMVEEAARNGKPFEYRLRVIPRDVPIRHVFCRGITRRNAAGEVSMVFGVFADITEQLQMEEALHEANVRLNGLAHVDSLTGLANRRRFDHVLEQEWRRAAREKECVSLVMVDIDRFKQFNDRYGHVAGDDCLRRVAAVVERQGRRATDLAARYGGEEMVLLLPATTAAGAEIVARECRSSIASLGIWHEGNMSCGGVVTASFGVATALPSASDAESEGWIELIAQADRLLYEAKRTGRNKVVTQTSIVLSAVAPTGVEEDARLASLARYEAAGATRRSQEMDSIARLAATLTGAPIGLVSLVGREEQRFAGNFGLPGVDGSTREESFCAHTILGDEPMVIADATRDPRFDDNNLVVGDLGVRYYAGAPIVSPTSGHKLGAVCVVDTKAREKTGLAERAMLTDLAGMVAALLEANTRPVDRRQK